MFDLQEMSLLEMKHGLLQIAESLEFLHSNARLIHRAISPEVSALPYAYFLHLALNYRSRNYLLVLIVNL